MIDTPVSEGARQSLTANPPAGEPTLTQLVSGIAEDAQRLIRQQYQMLRAEVREDIRWTKTALKYMGLGIGAAFVGAVFLAVALPLILNDVLNLQAHPWAGWAIIGAVMLVLGVIGFFAGKRIFEKNNPLPDKTLNALEENLSWIANNRK
ncbi:MAG TPA: phage holin family protein [Gemmataceae bacterium]|nr:phage holin family protein [Gemmataceae bacterium]